MDRRRNPEAGRAGCGCVDPERRRSVGLLLAAGLAAALPEPADAAADPAVAKAPPQVGDELVFVKGPRKGETVTVGDLAEIGAVVQAWPKDPATDTVRSRSRLNRVLLVRIEPDGLDPRTEARAAEGIVAYSGFCTHAGCFIEKFLADEQAIFCHCHDSKFDPRANGKVVGGPAKAPLAGLPIRIEDGRVLVAGEFDGKLGVPKA